MLLPLGLRAAIGGSTLPALDASAWGSEAHRLIAEVAESQLTAAARAEVNQLRGVDLEQYRGIGREEVRVGLAA